MVLLATGARFGLRRGLPFVAGVALGKQLIIWPLGFGLMAIQDDFPLVFEALKWISIAYILWLAYRVAGMRLTVGEAEGQPPGFMAGLIVHPLNPKAWGMITTGFTTFVTAGTPPLQATATIAACLLGLQIILHPIWTYAGQWIATRLVGTMGEKYLMWTMAGLTVLSVIYALYGGALFKRTV
jgi:threonine/homoserine/homoserine lactone efflux protein